MVDKCIFVLESSFAVLPCLHSLLAYIYPTAMLHVKPHMMNMTGHVLSALCALLQESCMRRACTCKRLTCVGTTALHCRASAMPTCRVWCKKFHPWDTL